MSLRSTQTQTLKWWVWYLQRCHLFHLPFLAAPIWDCYSRLYLPHFLVSSSPSALSTKQQFLRKCMSTKILFCWHHNVLFWKRKDTFEKQNIDKKKKKRLDCLRKARCQGSAATCLTLSPPLFTRPVPMIHRVTRSWFGRNITAFISWPLFCRQLSLSGWNLTRHVDKEICPRRQH